MKPDPEKFQEITDMPPSAVEQQLQSLLGIINFMQPYIPHSHTTQHSLGNY